LAKRCPGKGGGRKKALRHEIKRRKRGGGRRIEDEENLGARKIFHDVTEKGMVQVSHMPERDKRKGGRTRGKAGSGRAWKKSEGVAKIQYTSGTKKSLSGRTHASNANIRLREEREKQYVLGRRADGWIWKKGGRGRKWSAENGRTGVSIKRVENRAKCSLRWMGKTIIHRKKKKRL